MGPEILDTVVLSEYGQVVGLTLEHPVLMVVPIQGGERCSQSPWVGVDVVVSVVFVVVLVLFVVVSSVSSGPDLKDRGAE
jgi:hypothetical protein